MRRELRSSPGTYDPGSRYGRLFALSIFEDGSDGKTQVLCVCDCGTVRTFRLNNLKSGIAKSCGCLRREKSSKVNLRHGCRRVSQTTSEYRVWLGMVYRTTNPKSNSFKYYGGKGVKVCERWLGPQGFLNFLSDMGPRPVERSTNGLRSRWSIDRFPDPDGNYEPGNCRWATQHQQNNNHRPRAKKRCRV